MDLQEYKNKLHTIWYVRIVEWNEVEFTEMELSRHIPNYYINHWDKRAYELGFCFHTATEQEAIELALERAKVVKTEFERFGNFNKACKYLEEKFEEEHGE